MLWLPPLYIHTHTHTHTHHHRMHPLIISRLCSIFPPLFKRTALLPAPLTCQNQFAFLLCPTTDFTRTLPHKFPPQIQDPILLSIQAPNTAFATPTHTSYSNSPSLPPHLSSLGQILNSPFILFLFNTLSFTLSFPFSYISHPKSFSVSAFIFAHFKAHKSKQKET